MFIDTGAQPGKVQGQGQVLKPDGSVRTDTPPPPKPDEAKK